MKTIEYIGSCLGRLVWIMVYALIALPILILALIGQLLITGKVD